MLPRSAVTAADVDLLRRHKARIIEYLVPQDRLPRVVGELESSTPSRFLNIDVPDDECSILGPHQDIIVEHIMKSFGYRPKNRVAALLDAAEKRFPGKVKRASQIREPGDET